jgi:hypothetical protein
MDLLKFLRGFADALAVFTAQLEQYAQAADLPGHHPRLALGHGLAVHRASLQWAQHTIAALAAAPTPAPAGAERLA